MKRPNAVLAKRSYEIDLEDRSFRIEKGKTYFDDGTTIFDVYVVDGIKDGWLEETERRPDTIIVSSRQRVRAKRGPMTGSAANPESRGICRICIWIPGPALKRRSGMTVSL